MFSLFSLVSAACTDFGGTMFCDPGDICTSLSCDCGGVNIGSWVQCSAVPMCNFNGNSYASWTILTWYKFVQFGSLNDVGNYQVMTCQSNASRSPSTWMYTHSRYAITAPTWWYCVNSFGGTMWCEDQQRCNTPTWCDCDGSLSYTYQCHKTCSATTYTNISWYIYSIPALAYWSSVIITTGVTPIANGIINYSQWFMCSWWTFLATGNELSWVSCNPWYDNISNICVLHQSWGWSVWGGGSYIPTCIVTDLMCVNGTYQHKPGGSCQWGNLGHSCTIGSGGNGTWTLPVGSILWSPYTNEFNQAYLWAYAHGITTMNTIQKANMWTKLLRSDMAKMIVNFAITLGGLTPNTGKQCTFTDIAHQSAEMKFYIKLSCQLGLMGVGIHTFNPTGDITRAEFGTVLSRVLWGTTYEWWVKYYTNHLNALKAAGIMTQITNPTSMLERRWYVMLMMKRAYELWLLN